MADPRQLLNQLRLCFIFILRIKLYIAVLFYSSRLCAKISLVSPKRSNGFALSTLTSGSFLLLSSSSCCDGSGRLSLLFVSSGVGIEGTTCSSMEENEQYLQCLTLYVYSCKI